MENKERTLYCGNLSDKVTADLLYELFLQAGPLENVSIPKDKDGRQRNYGFVTFKHAVSVPYAIALMGGLSLYGKPLRLNARSDSESAPNPYLEQLRQYQNSMNRQPFHQSDSRMHDSRSRRHDSRRYEPRSESDKNRFDSMNMPSSLTPVLYPRYNQQPYVPSQNFPPNHGGPYPQRFDMHPNQWPGYNR